MSTIGNGTLLLAIYIGMMSDAFPMKKNSTSPANLELEEEKWMIKGFKPEKEPTSMKDINEDKVSSYPKGQLKWDENRHMYYYGDPLPLERKPENLPPPAIKNNDMVEFNVGGDNDGRSLPSQPGKRSDFERKKKLEDFE